MMTAPEFDPGDWMGQGVELAGRLAAYVGQLRVSALPVSAEAAVDHVLDDLGSILRREWNPVDEPL